MIAKKSVRNVDQMDLDYVFTMAITVGQEVIATVILLVSQTLIAFPHGLPDLSKVHAQLRALRTNISLSWCVNESAEPLYRKASLSTWYSNIIEQLSESWLCEWWQSLLGCPVWMLPSKKRRRNKNRFFRIYQRYAIERTLLRKIENSRLRNNVTVTSGFYVSSFVPF